MACTGGWCRRSGTRLLPERKAVVREAPRLGPVMAHIDQMLVSDLQAPRKQRHTALDLDAPAQGTSEALCRGSHGAALCAAAEAGLG